MEKLRIGIIGTDSSHAVAFTKLLNDAADPYYVPGGKVTKAYKSSSPDFELSYSRAERFCRELREYGVELTDDIQSVVNDCDALLLESADGRVRLEQFRQAAPARKPVFIDKSLGITLRDARQIVELAWDYETPVMSGSALRYAVALEEGLARIDRSTIKKATVMCPLPIEPTQSRYFWYGIHGAEMLYRILGQGCKEVQVDAAEGEDILTGYWENEVIGKVIARHDPGQPFEAEIVTDSETIAIRIADGKTPFYASLLQQAMVFFEKKTAPIPYGEMLEVVSFLQAAETSYGQRRSVPLQS
ncbi:Gfo/Idh/MocA family protein [Cohnella massiliensis]|uniref:Gfo/Idh/MocA family protein n=1 Tax=Cohnella massiliensis TaxID=1816691 RepID=UPI0009BC532C|nr:hypothetical protein [Cohnella massiliensis]